MNNLEFRTFTEDDLEFVLAIENTVHLSPWKPSSFQPCFTGRSQGWSVFNDGELCGYAIVSMVVGEAELLNMSVAKQYQGKGVGSALLRFICEQVSKKCDNFFLEVRESNEAAIALYEKFYFCEVGRRNNYYPAKKGREDALIYALTF